MNNKRKKAKHKRKGESKTGGQADVDQLGAWIGTMTPEIKLTGRDFLFNADVKARMEKLKRDSYSSFNLSLE